MAQNHIDHLVYRKLKETFKTKHVIYIFGVLIAIIFTFSVFDAILFVLCYIFGFVLFYFILKFKVIIITPLLKLLLVIKRSSYLITSSSLSNIHCNICEGETCSRYLLNNCHEPWRNIFLHKQLDLSIENFYATILKLFITPWYSKITKEETLLIELRYLLRYTSSLLINRAIKVDIGKLITSKLIPCAMRHYAICEEAQRIMKTNGSKNLDEAALDGPLKYSLHPALMNRECELEYLRRITEKLLKILLPKQEFESKFFNILIREIFAGWVLLSLTDVLADPSIINTLVILATGNEKIAQLPELPNHHVVFLENFVDKKSYKRMRLLSLEVSEILKTPVYLYSFMQFMKTRGKIHLLQFCLDIDEFNKKMIQPEINPKEQDALYNHAHKLYSLYFSHESSSSIAFDSEYLDEFNSILKEGPQNIVKLQRCKFIYEAYDYVFSSLEKEWGPKFFDSDEFYKLIIPDATAELKKLTSNKSDKSNSSIIGKPLSKLKDAFKSQAIEGQLDNNDSNDNDSVEGVDIETQYSDILANYAQLKNKDMSTWRVSIENVIERKASNKAGILDWFLIIIQRIDPHGMGDDSQWSVERNDRDFLKLKEKLIEFHGESIIGDVSIPPKRIKAAAKIRKSKYEVLLQHFLGMPSLRSSELLYMFLKANGDFSSLAKEASSDSSGFMDFGSLYQSVSHKLRKEKGQHLDNFVQKFLVSTDVEYYQTLSDEKKKTSDYEEEATDIMNDMTLPTSKSYRRCLTDGVFGNNFNLYDVNFKLHTTLENKPTWSFSQCVYMILKDVFQVRQVVVGIVDFFCEIDGPQINDYCDTHINNFLCKVLSQPRLGHLIKLGQDLLFNNSSSSSLSSATKIEIQKEKYKKAKTQLQNAFPSFLTKVTGPNFLKSVDTLLTFLQNPKLNKHFVYTLFDIVFVELFPELENVIKHEKS